MEQLQTLIVIESYGLGLLLCLAVWHFYLKSKRLTDLRIVGLMSLFFFYCLPGIVAPFSPLILRTVIPMDQIKVQLPTAISMVLLIVSVLIGLLIRLGPPKRLTEKKKQKLDDELAIRYRLGSLFFVSFLFFCVGFIGVYAELHAAGGWFAVIQGGNSAYMEARVKTAGFWAILMCFVPIGTIGMMYSVAQSKSVPPQLRWPIILTILAGAVGLVSLVTTRNLTIMLLLSVLAFLELRAGKLFRFVAPFMIGLMVLGAMGLASFRYSSRRPGIDQITGNLEQVKVSEEIIAKIDMRGYVWGGNIPDLFVVAVPRVFWPNKPSNSTINRAVFNEWARQGARMAGVKVLGLLGEAYASGGFFWVVLEGFICGVMLRRLHLFWDRRHTNSFQFLAYGAVSIGYTYMVVKVGFVGPHDVTFLAMLFQIAVVNRFCGYQITQESLQSTPIISG